MLHYYSKMFEYFPKLRYDFTGISGGVSLEVTDIFRSVNLIFDKEAAVLTTTSLPGERPDQLASRLYQTPAWYWSLFLTNNVRNPFREWAQTKDSFLTNIEKEYSGWVYQFANTSQFLPYVDYPGFSESSLQAYQGTNLDGILPGDILIYETGSGPFGIRCYGVGGITSDNFCGLPHLGQSIIPDSFDKQNAINKISAGQYFSAALDSRGYIYIWGQNSPDVILPQQDSLFLNKGANLFQSRFGGFTYIKASGSRLFAINTLSGSPQLSCYGECSDFIDAGVSSVTNAKKISGTKDLSGGVIIKTDNTTVSFGSITAPSSLIDVDCGSGFCVGITGSSLLITAFGTNLCNNILSYPGVTGITAISAGTDHALALKDDGTLYSWGCNNHNELNMPTNQYKSISAGRHHSSALNYNNNLVITGDFSIYGEGGCVFPFGDETSEIPIGLSGEYSQISSGYNHIILKQTGENKKYIGVVDSVDTAYKRIFVNFYQSPDDNEVLFKDPSGTLVSIWRYNTTQQKYIQIKSIQHQLLSITKYIDSTKYIEQNGQIVDMTYGDNWENIYLQKYKTPEENDDVVTLKKELLDIDLYNKTQIKNLSYSNVVNLENAIRQIFSSGSDVNEIRISNL